MYLYSLSRTFEKKNFCDYHQFFNTDFNIWKVVKRRKNEKYKSSQKIDELYSPSHKPRFNLKKLVSTSSRWSGLNGLDLAETVTTPKKYIWKGYREIGINALFGLSYSF